MTQILYRSCREDGDDRKDRDAVPLDTAVWHDQAVDQRQPLIDKEGQPRLQLAKLSAVMTWDQHGWPALKRDDPAPGDPCTSDQLQTCRSWILRHIVTPTISSTHDSEAQGPRLDVPP